MALQWCFAGRCPAKRGVRLKAKVPRAHQAWSPNTGLSLPDKAILLSLQSPGLHPSRSSGLSLSNTQGAARGIRALGELSQTQGTATSFLTPGLLSSVCSFYPLQAPGRQRREHGEQNSIYQGSVLQGPHSQTHS